MAWNGSAYNLQAIDTSTTIAGQNEDLDHDGAFDVFEDRNHNHQLDPGEDLDHDGHLTPPGGCEGLTREDADCDGRLDDAIAAVTANGGNVLQAKHAIGPYGFRAILLDTEGNRVALHSH